MGLGSMASDGRGSSLDAIAEANFDQWKGIQGLQALKSRTVGAGGLYNLGTVLALFGGIIVHCIAAPPSQNLSITLRDILFGGAVSASLTVSMVIFLIGGEVYHRAYETGPESNHRLVTLGDLLFGIAAIISTMALASVGNTTLALLSGALLTISKFGSVLFPEAGPASMNTPKVSAAFRWMAMGNKIPALACLLVTLLSGLRVGEGNPELNLAAIMFVSYLLWLAGDILLLQASTSTKVQEDFRSTPPRVEQPEPFFIDYAALRANETSTVGEFLRGAKARSLGLGGRYMWANVVSLVGGITVYCIATASFQGLGAAIWKYFFGSTGSASLTLATVTFLIGGEVYHRANTRYNTTNLHMIRLGDFIIGVAAIFLTFALASFGNHYFAILAGLLLIVSKWGSAALPTKANGSKAYANMCAAFRWMTIASRFPSLAAVGITLYAAAVGGEFSSQVAVATIIFISQLMLLSGDWLLLKITKRA